MFSWICPKCGNEVPPSRDVCPRCSPPAPPQETAAAQPATAVPPAAQVSAYAQPVPQQFRFDPTPAVVPAPRPVPVPQEPAPVPVQPAPQPVYTPPTPVIVAPKSTGLRDLLVTLGIAALLLAGGYFVWNRMEERDSPSTEQAKAPLETPGAAAPHPMAKHLELTGFRVREPKPGMVEVKMVLVNHSAADMTNLALGVVLMAKGTNKEVASFPIKVKNLAPFASTELSANVKTTMRAYELPDWQFLEARFTVALPE